MLESRILVSLIEMLVVLLIISILLLLFVPNLSKQK
ncbi:prepilin-type N-terminal cleavage/methylation domain-containing protein, partial [Streptococcus salivarius]